MSSLSPGGNIDAAQLCLFADPSRSLLGESYVKSHGGKLSGSNIPLITPSMISRCRLSTPPKAIQTSRQYVLPLVTKMAHVVTGSLANRSVRHSECACHLERVGTILVSAVPLATVIRSNKMMYEPLQRVA